MGETIWTREQQAAIDTHGCNLLVAAAAGSGKTAVLVERIIKMVTDIKNPMDIDRLLVVTFTNAAASEMKERIAKSIGDELIKHPKSVQLQRQLTLLNRASITTIHSFCLEVIRSNFHYLDIDPNFRVGDETETILLKGEVMEEMFEELYEEEHCSKEFLNLVEFYSNNRDDFALQNIVLDLYNFVMSSPNPVETLNTMAEDFNVEEDYDFGSSKWAEIIIEDIKLELMGLKDLMENSIDIINNTEGLDPYLENFQDELSMINDLILSCDSSWDNLKSATEKVEFKKLKSCRNCKDKANQETVKDIRDKVKKQIKDDMKGKLLLYAGEETAKDLRELYPIMRALSDLVIDFMNRYGRAKRERGIIDFNDFEHFCLHILSMPEVASSLKEKYIEILVDEYQDSNEVQEAIVNSIARKEEATGRNINVFMVGDVKQSIYRFRQAKPELFLSKYNSYSLEEGEKERKITLFKNFRSRKEVLDAVNFIFKQIMSVNVGELEYDESEALNLGADYKEFNEEGSAVGGSIELNIIDRSSDDIAEEADENKEEASSEEEEVLSNIQIEARLVAKRINELVNPKVGEVFKVFDKNINGYRKVEYRDIVILLRSTSSWAPVFMDELKEYLVPAYADVGNGYFETLEIRTMLSLLQIIDNPRQDIPLIAVLRSPFASFTPEELIDVRLENKNGDFYEGLVTMASKVDVSTEEDSLEKKCSDFLAKLSVWRDRSIHMPIDEFIWHLYMETGYYGYVGALAGGLQRQANLRILFQRARQYERTSYKGLFNFINFINKLKVSSGDMGSAKILGENENVVRIMSIHKSKGLEFPVVFLSALGKNFNMQDLNKRILFHNELGYGPDYINLEKRLSYPTVLKQALRKKIKIETLSEEMRILYVALTRAKEKLIMVGGVNNIEKHAKKWAYGLKNSSLKLPEYEISKAKSYLDWIAPVVLRHVDGEELRKAAGIEDYNPTKLLEDASNWQVKLHNVSNIVKAEAKEEVLLEEALGLEEEEIKNKYYDKINNRLNWEYDYLKASELPTLLTVTEVKRMHSRDMSRSLNNDYAQDVYTPSLVSRPSFMEKDKKLTGAEKGTAVHAVMQKLDFKGELSAESIEAQLKEFVGKNLITEEQKESVDISKILKFFNSDIGKRIIKAEKVYKEVPFHIQLNSTEIFTDLPKEQYKDEKIMLQGIIDCYFEEEGEIILVDYKTDYYKEGQGVLMKERYKVQLDYYARAIEVITNKEVKEKYLYLFYNNEELSIN